MLSAVDIKHGVPFRASARTNLNNPVVFDFYEFGKTTPLTIGPNDTVVVSFVSAEPNAAAYQATVFEGPNNTLDFAETIASVAGGTTLGTYFNLGDVPHFCQRGAIPKIVGSQSGTPSGARIGIRGVILRG